MRGTFCLVLVCVYMCVYVCICVYMCVYARIRAYMCVYLRTHTYIYINVRIKLFKPIPIGRGVMRFCNVNNESLLRRFNVISGYKSVYEVYMKALKTI